MQLPTDLPPPTIQTYAGKTLSFVIPASLSEELKTLSKQEGVTLFMPLLALERNLSYNLVFQVMFLLQNTAMKKLELPGLRAELLENKATTVKFDLTLVIEDVEQGLMASVEYSTDLFDEITVSH